MERFAFLVKVFPGKLAEVTQTMEARMPAVAKDAVAAGASNFSVWRAEDIIFGYYEADTESNVGTIIRSFIDKEFHDSAILVASPGNMRLMYSAIGSPREDKKSLRHRVFVTRLKPGCAEEYKLRHDNLAAKQSEEPIEGPINNFTIWNAGDYICGYNEIDPDYIEDADLESEKLNVEWEIRMLEIMDWLTDDVDHISGEKHEKVECLFI
ncbi:MAG: L-rhamnose mutarotase [Eubacteriales bacterium]|jgi:L-rhamnose mutarotase